MTTESRNIVNNFRELMKLKDVMELTGKSRSTVLRWESGAVYGFPQKLKIGPNSIAWRREDIQGWIDSLPKRGLCYDN